MNTSTDEGLYRYDGKALTHETKGWDARPNVMAIHIDTSFSVSAVERAAGTFYFSANFVIYS